ncbi:MAG: lycopene cyclase domain-containing protein [Ignavibacteriae bacterium]|nr:lycopene cyclase domain-containing protein [Ignavibacteriota bacterium]
MKYEYLIFNLIVLSGPIFFGSLKKFYFLNYWKSAIISIVISAVPFIIWDIFVTNRHWYFSENYIIGFKIFELPIEEIMFFLTVPFACLFTWEMLKRFYDKNYLNDFKNVKTFDENFFISIISVFFLFLILIAVVFDKEYTAISLTILIASIIIDKTYGAKLFRRKLFWIYISIVSVFTFIFNGYLTWRPIVTYNEIYQLGFRIFTIPIEDFLFGYALIILSTTIFEKQINRNFS